MVANGGESFISAGWDGFRKVCMGMVLGLSRVELRGTAATACRLRLPSVNARYWRVMLTISC